MDWVIFKCLDSFRDEKSEVQRKQLSVVSSTKEYFISVA